MAELLPLSPVPLYTQLKELLRAHSRRHLPAA
jgi:hypothetical protein